MTEKMSSRSDPINGLRKHAWYAIALGLYLLSHTTDIHPAVDARIIQIDVPDRKIAQLYVAMLDRDIESASAYIHTTDFLLPSTIQDASGTPRALFPALSTRNSSLRTAEFACAMAYAYQMPASKWHGKPELLTKISSIMTGFATQTHIDKTIQIAGQHADRYSLTLHLIPLTHVYVLLSDHWSKEQREAFLPFIQKGIHYLLTHPIRWQNEKGMAWCALMALYGRCFQDPKYLAAALESLAWFQPLIAPSGEYLDPVGLDLIRANRFITSLFLYRLYSGQEDWDTRIRSCLHWYAQLLTPQGIPLFGFRDRLEQTSPSLIASLLGAYTYYAEQEKPFSQVATRYLQSLMNSKAGFTLSQGGYPFLVGCRYHNRPEKLDALPYHPSLQIFGDSPHSTYLIARRQYQTAVMLDDPAIVTGLQCWAYKNHKPLIMPARTAASGMAGFGYDSRSMRRKISSSAFPPRLTSVTDGIDVLITQSKGFVSAYVFTDEMTIVIHKQPFEDSTLDLIQNTSACSPLEQIAGTRLTFANNPARLFLPPSVVPNYEENEWGNRLRFHFKSPYFWYTFAGPQSFSLVEPIPDAPIFVHVQEGERTCNFILNLSPQRFAGQRTFPKTTIPIPAMEPWTGKVIAAQT